MANATSGGSTCVSVLNVAMPRFDLTVDVVTMNKMVLLELIFKYLPQFILQNMLNSAVGHSSRNRGEEEVRGWTTSAVIACLTSGLSLVYTARGSYQTWKYGTWASDLPDLDAIWQNVKQRICFQMTEEVSATVAPVVLIPTGRVPLQVLSSTCNSSDSLLRELKSSIKKNR